MKKKKNGKLWTLLQGIDVIYRWNLKTFWMIDRWQNFALITEEFEQKNEGQQRILKCGNGSVKASITLRWTKDAVVRMLLYIQYIIYKRITTRVPKIYSSFNNFRIVYVAVKQSLVRTLVEKK